MKKFIAIIVVFLLLYKLYTLCNRDEIYRKIYSCNPTSYTTITPNEKLDVSSCVAFVKAKVPKLKNINLSLYTDKKKIINVVDKKGKPILELKYIRPGMVAICPTNIGIYEIYGHIAYVEKVDHIKRRIYLSNGSTSKKQLFCFWTTIKKLKIDGFYDPCLDN